MSPFSNYLVRSNLYISIAAVAHYLYYAFKYDDGFSIPLIGLIFSATYFGYHILRLNAWKFHKKYIGHENIRFYNRNKISLTFIATILLIVTAILIRFFVVYGTSVTMSPLVILVIVPLFEPLPLSVKVGKVSPSPFLHQLTGDKLVKSAGLPLL